MNNKVKIFFVTSLFIVLSVSTTAQAQTYISGNLGLGMLQNSEIEDDEAPGETIELGFDNGLILSGAIGYIMNSFRAELEIAYQKNDMDTFGVDGLEVDASVIDEFDGNFSSFTGLVNGYYDFDTGTDFMPYLTAGIGLSTVDIEISLDDDELFDEPINESDDDSVIAYHLGAGIGYLISENIIIDLRYRYFMTSDPKFDTVSAEYGSHNITGGIRINF